MPDDIDADNFPDDAWECRLCGAPGGFPYCNDACRDADQDDEDDDYTVTFLALDTRKP